MRTIWKFPIAYPDRPITSEWPVGAKVLHIDLQHESIYDLEGALHVWLLVDSEAPTEEVRLSTIGTGHPVPKGEYIGTVIDNAEYVWHAFVERGVQQ